MKNSFFSIGLIFLSITVLAQSPAPGNHGNANNKQFNVGHFYGKIVDEKSDKGIEFATIQLFQTKYDSVNKKMKKKLVTGALSESNGDFSMENLPVMGQFMLHVSAIGYDSLNQQVSFDLKINQGANMQQMLSAADKDLGNIKLNPLAVELSGVVVTADDPLYKLELDKKVYNVDKDPSNTGGTARKTC